MLSVMVSELAKWSYAATMVVDTPVGTGSTSNSTPARYHLDSSLRSPPRKTEHQRRRTVKDYSNSQFLHNNDMASIMLVNTPLTGPNYSS